MAARTLADETCRAFGKRRPGGTLKIGNPAGETPPLLIYGGFGRRKKWENHVF